MWLDSKAVNCPQKWGNFSAFIVSVPFQDPLAEKALLYLVTARHVIEAAEGENIWVRANMQDGSSNMVETKKSLWLTHPTDNSVDVAVLPFNFQGPLLAKYVPVSTVLDLQVEILTRVNKQVVKAFRSDFWRHFVSFPSSTAC